MKGFAVALGATLLSWGAPLHAQVQVDANVSSQTVEAGQQFQFQLDAQGGAESPENPRLVAPPSFVVRGPSVSTQMQFSMGFGGRSISRGLSATWILVAQKTGKFVLGPGSVSLDGNQYQSKTITIQVVPQGSLPQQQPRGRRSPFGGIDPFDSDPFSGFPNLRDLLDDQEPSLPEYPKDLEIPTPLDPVAFLRATVEPERVYIGQQITLRIYAYGGRGPFNQGSAHEAAHADFLARPIVDGSDVTPFRVPIGDRVWFAAKIREMALFPIRTGQLQIGAMEYGFGGGRYPAKTPSNALLRKSPPLNVEVVVPPLDGRPAGYQLGDVGSFSLQAQVEPRQIEAGGAVSVVVTLNGTGNLPSALKVPVRKGVDFLTPATTEKLDFKDGKLGGTKTFSYVVRVSDPGTVELGEISLPYFDPNEQRYHVAAANLGTLVVRPGAPAPPAPTSNDPKGLMQLTQTLKPRTELAKGAEPPRYLGDQRLFWGALLLGPLSVLSFTALVRLGRNARARFTARRQSNSAQLQLDLKLADEAARAERLADTATAVERALYRAIEATTGLKARGILRHELERTLLSRGFAAPLAREVVAALEQCDLLRFDQRKPEHARELAAQARTLTKKLTAQRPRVAASETGGPAS